MSALGQKRTCVVQKGMSALLPIAHRFCDAATLAASWQQIGPAYISVSRPGSLGAGSSFQSVHLEPAR